MNAVEKSHLIGWDKLNALDRLNVKLNGRFKITGSISLLKHGVITRPIGDIDIVAESLDWLKLNFDKKENNMTQWFDYSEPMEKNCKSIQGKGKIPNRVSFNIGSVKVCAFFGEHNPLYSRVFDFFGERKFNVLHPKFSIKAKQKFVINLINNENIDENGLSMLKKHYHDIVLYRRFRAKQQLNFSIPYSF